LQKTDAQVNICLLAYALLPWDFLAPRLRNPWVFYGLLVDPKGDPQEPLREAAWNRRFRGRFCFRKTGPEVKYFKKAFSIWMAKRDKSDPNSRPKSVRKTTLRECEINRSQTPIFPRQSMRIIRSKDDKSIKLGFTGPIW